ncbi:uncharacterized protein TRAVEDRAFT_133595 [Trametes versicolor FP-101664 SS1]|uniref:uncharacterized protein n=1 Tax=Trametes versicolor (strain FP-101664) TaxID=717944 RepID=UPI000462378C|nr:uncharacterized protein TRAVEDRAFT_133595 [Trametes versicolor FP-101664 SS1]EIW53680.1 hypothetical protein TRAVEDRAFT_133595 [Trametes versicolor FP-101664 SS1]
MVRAPRQTDALGANYATRAGHERALEYLTVTACRRNLAGDMCAIMRVHAFLEQWGLINYQINPDQRPAALAPPFTGHFRVTLDTPRGLQSLNPGTRPKDSNAQAAVNGATKPSPTPASLELRNSIYQTSAESLRPVFSTEAASLANGANGISGDNPTTIKYQCHTCGIDCTSVRFHLLKQKSFELCPPCYLDGHFPSHMYSGDFVKLTSTTSANGVHQAAGAAADDDWSDQEILLLLEGVEMYDDDWWAIEEHVGTRSAQQCIRKFLQLPIEDPYLSAEGDLGPLRYTRVLFEQADNPVMSVVAFLAGVISPGVTAEAAKTAGALVDAEDLQIRSMLASLIKLTLTKLELKTAQFDELEDELEDEHKSLKSARMTLVNERVNLRRLLDNVRSELAKHGATPIPGLANAVAQAQTGLGASGQGTKVNEVQGGAPAESDQGR